MTGTAGSATPGRRLPLALDIGGTKIAAALVTPGGELVRTAVMPTPRGDGEQVWQAVARLLTEMTADGPVTGVGIACAGPMDGIAETVSPINIGGWDDFPLRQRVAALVSGVPVRIANDGLAMALGEHRLGAGRGCGYMLGMVVSTGVGGGLVLDGTPYQGRSGNAGHVGHVVVDPGGVACTCGGHGCVETIASGPRLAAWAREHGWSGADAKELAQAAAAGDDVAVRAFRRGARALAATIASVGAVCDLELVVIGGGVAKSGPVLFDPLREELSRYAGLDFLAGLRVVPAELGGDAGLIGAAALVAP